MDQVARAVNLTPEEFRRRNFLPPGSRRPATGQVIHEAVDFDGLLDRAFQQSDFHAKRERFARENPDSSIKRGIGFGVFHARERVLPDPGRSVPGIRGGGRSDYGVEVVRILGRVSTEIGQGTNTIFSQIAADALGISFDLIEIGAARHRGGAQ